MSSFARIICDSISLDRVRLTTFHLRYPRMIHSEFMTHRVFSRNGRSSRAVPVFTLLREAAYMPDFRANQKGMQPGQKLTPFRNAVARSTWRTMIWMTRSGVRLLHWANVHKQWANRPLEWFGYIDVLVTSVSWNNFFELRIHGDAQDEIRELAELMKKALDNSTPKLLREGEWHLPYIDYEIDAPKVAFYLTEQGGVVPAKDEIDLHLRKVSAARCARMSYKPFDGDGSIKAELARYSRLIESRPVHASPVEHQATPDRLRPSINYPFKPQWLRSELHGNLPGWIQFRKMIPDEFVPG